MPRYVSNAIVADNEQHLNGFPHMENFLCHWCSVGKMEICILKLEGFACCFDSFSTLKSVLVYNYYLLLDSLENLKLWGIKLKTYNEISTLQNREKKNDEKKLWETLHRREVNLLRK